MIKKIMAMLTALTIGILLLYSFGGASGSERDDALLIEPVNPAFIKHMNRLRSGEQFETTKSGYVLNYSPAPVTVSHIKGAKDPAVNIDYPAYYDLRASNMVSWIQNQGSFFTCWVFSAYTSLESCLLPDENADYSEWHLANFNGFDYGLLRGGNSWVSTAYLIRWDGPVRELYSPYPTEPNPVPGEYKLPIAKHIQQVIFLPERESVMDNNTIKYFITNYGPVDFAFNFNTGSFNEGTASIYTPYDQDQNHRLAIVGWDDNYPASNFKYTPPGNGAFIARNSWGSSWGDGGYCYISYYDESFEEFTCFNNAEPTTNYDTIYQHDFLGRTSTWGKKDSYGGNIFTAVDARPIKAVGFYTNDANVVYEIFVYKHVEPSTNNPASGTLAAYKTGGFTYAGYYTVPLDTLVPVSTGEKFSVVVHWTNPTHNHSVPIERPIAEHSSQAFGNPGESFVSLDGSEWKDLISEVDNANVCIKAYSQFPQVGISFHAERQTVEAWLVHRDFISGHFSIDDLENSPVTDIVVYRRKDNSAFVEHTRLKPEDLPSGTYFFWEYVRQDVQYTYMVVTLDANIAETGKSIEILL